MDFLERWLKRWPLLISLGLTLITACLLGSEGIVGPDAMTYGDGQRYATRAFTLYGYLHTGQWLSFWDRFTLDKIDTLAPLHYWIFFLLPSGWAGPTTYGALLGATTYLVLALGLWGLCRVLDRPEWTPALFLLCASQNISLEFSYYYFCDLPFFALGTVALAFQLRAWKRNTFSSSVLSGLSAASMYWVKPANAVIFAATYLLAETAHAAIRFWQQHHRRTIEKPPAYAFARHFSGITLGYLPMLVLVMACGSLQTIMRLLDANEVSDLFTTHLTCTGLQRLFYFPLCLTYYYNTLVGAVVIFLLLVATSARGYFLTARPSLEARVPRAFPWERLLPLVIAYLILGEYFSFGMATKTLRSLLLVLPLFWLLAFWGAERIRLRLPSLFLAVVAYVSIAYAQVFFDILPAEAAPAESYQLTGDWLIRFPHPIDANKNFSGQTRYLLGYLHRLYPQGAKIAIGSDMLYYTADSLAWFENSDRLLHGQAPLYQFERFLRVDGSYYRQALIGASCLILYTQKDIQYSGPVTDDTHNLILYAQTQWQDQDQLVRILPLLPDIRRGREGIIGCVIVFRQPISAQMVADAIAATHAPGYAVDQDEFDAFHDRRLTWRDCYDVLLRWVRKQF